MRGGLLGVALLLAGAAAWAAPEPGRYAGQLCVATGAAAPSCGPVDSIELRPGGRLRVQVSDIVYLFELHAAELDATLLHGAMQIDEFSAGYSWTGNTLRFADVDKRARYELRLDRAL